MEKETVIVYARCGRTAQPPRIQSPQENPNVWDIVFSFGAFDVPNIDGMRGRFESGAESLERLPLAQIRCVKIRRANVIHELRPLEQLEELDSARVPARDIPRQLLEYTSSPFAPAITNRVRHFRPRCELVGRDWMQRAISDQVADVREDPWRAGFDELIVVKLLEIFLDNSDLPCDKREQFAQWLALFYVANAMHRRQQVVELVRVVAHGITSKSIGAGSRVSSSAAPNEAGSPP